jgi:Fic-DOC domain mobile mystery protein B
MGLELEPIHGQTPLTEEEKEGLLIPSISTRAELDEFEQQNIERAIKWTLGKRFQKDRLLSESFIRRLHKEMYGDVWSWAGTFRKSNKNLGIDWHTIPIEIRKLIDDCNFWIYNKTYPPDEIAVRFKHRIVQIHCFANGNGRHSRLMGDLIREKLFNRGVFTWGSGANLEKEGISREEYIRVIREADDNRYDRLIQFANR